MIIVAISTKSGKNYTVGQNPAHLDEVIVEKIMYHREGNLYNKGFQIGVPAYSVAMEGSKLRRLIPEHEVAEVWIDITKKKKDDETPDMENFLTETTDNQEEGEEGEYEAS